MTRALLAALMACPGCALDAPPAQETLAPAAALSRPAPASQEEIDRTAAISLERARREPGSPQLALAAARDLFRAADTRRQRAALTGLDELPHPGLVAVLAADDDVPGPVRQAVLSLCTAGRELAEAALAADPSQVDAQLHLALHLSLIAWANGPARSLFAGLGPKVQAAIARAVELDPGFDHAAPLRLQGRFLSQAPWPYGDTAQARVVLQRALATAPIAVHHLFLGDVLHALGDAPGARAQWQLCTTAPDDESTRLVTPMLRELARRRVLASH